MIPGEGGPQWRYASLGSIHDGTLPKLVGGGGSRSILLGK